MKNTICTKCGEEIDLKNVVTTRPDLPPPKMVCWRCRNRMKKSVLTITVYEDGFTTYDGDCDICNQFPCEHTDNYWKEE